MLFMFQVTDKNGQQLQIGDEVTHVANPQVKGKIVQYGSSGSHYLGSS